MRVENERASVLAWWEGLRVSLIYVAVVAVGVELFIDQIG